MKNRKWLNKFIDKNELDPKHVFEIEHEGTSHFMKFDAVVNSIIVLPEEYQQKIINELMAINSRNGDVLHYLNHVAEGIIKYKT